MLRLLLALTLALSACGLLPQDLSPISVRIINRTNEPVTVHAARTDEIRWRVSGPNQPVVLTPGEAMSRSWGPDYDSRISGTDEVTIEADNAQGIIVFCHRYTIDEISRLRETVSIRDVDLECS